MNVDGARETLERAVETRPDGFATYVIGGTDLASAEAHRFHAEKAFGNQMQSDVWDEAKRISNRQFVQYDPSYQTSQSQVLVEDLPAIPELQAVDEEVRGGDVDTLTAQATESVVAMAHVAGSGDSRVVAYRMKGQGITAAKRRRGLVLVPSDGVYAPVTGAVLYYEPRFDVITCGGLAFFTAVSLIQANLHAPEKAMRLARDTFRQATAKISIDGVSELEEAIVNDPSMRAKMAQLSRLLSADPRYAHYLTTENLLKFVEENPGYEIAVSSVDGRRALKFDQSPQHRHKIPKLLTDDYLMSKLTNRQYEAGSKHDIN